MNNEAAQQRVHAIMAIFLGVIFRRSLRTISYYLNFCGNLIVRPRVEVLGGGGDAVGAAAASLSAIATAIPRDLVGF